MLKQKREKYAIEKLKLSLGKVFILTVLHYQFIDVVQEMMTYQHM